MNWTTGEDLKAQLRRLWERGDLLKPLVTGETQFPLRLTLKGPSSAQLTDQLAAVRAWLADLVKVQHCRIAWRQVNHRVLGSQRLPEAVWVDTLDDALALIGRRRDGERFVAVLGLTTSRQPALLQWLGSRPRQAIALAEQWPQLLAVVDWLAAHPRPGIYLRQVDIAGIHSKFIEAHRAVLAELLDLALPPGASDTARTGVGQFAARYGFRDKPTHIRFRVLDAGLALLPGPALPDLMLDAASFARLAAPIRRIFITENETNFLAFPPALNSIVIFGAGYGWETLARAEWVAGCAIHYWGDIDTHGFAILDQLRGRFAQVDSVLMDRPTLMAHAALWGEERDQVTHDLPRLTDAETALFNELRDNRIRNGLRLEQERVGFAWVRSALDAIIRSDRQ